MVYLPLTACLSIKKAIFQLVFIQLVYELSEGCQWMIISSILDFLFENPLSGHIVN